MGNFSQSPGNLTIGQSVRRYAWDLVTDANASVTLSAATHWGLRLHLTHATPAVTVPAGLPDGFNCTITSLVAFDLIADTGVVFNSEPPGTTLPVSLPSPTGCATVTVDRNATTDYYVAFGSI